MPWQPGATRKWVGNDPGEGRAFNPDSGQAENFVYEGGTAPTTPTTTPAPAQMQKPAPSGGAGSQGAYDIVGTPKFGGTGDGGADLAAEWAKGYQQSGGQFSPAAPSAPTSPNIGAGAAGPGSAAGGGESVALAGLQEALTPAVVRPTPTDLTLGQGIGQRNLPVYDYALAQLRRIY